jgi:hypothetical protein
MLLNAKLIANDFMDTSVDVRLNLLTIVPITRNKGAD